MTATLLLLAVSATAAGPGDRTPLFRLGGDPGPGVLVNRSPGARPFDPPDPTRPTVVFIHGFNPTPRSVRYLMGERLSEAIARRGGPPLNVLEWGWNAASVVSLRMRVNQENNVGQGLRLAAALRAAGVAPGRTHLIAHSSGAIVAASAARALRDGGGPPVAQITLLDAATHYHDVVFDRLAVGAASPRVENYWTDGPGGFGRHAARPGVWNHRVDLASPTLGALYMPRSAHWDLFRWYLATVEDRAAAVGYNASVTAAGQRR
jgi:pimeloyl-ACP methyl ester carboxylesterase